MNKNWRCTFPKKLLLRAYSTLKHSLSTTKVNYSSKMKISLCVLILVTMGVTGLHNSYPRVLASLEFGSNEYVF